MGSVLDGSDQGARHEFGIDRRAEQFGELDQLGMGAAVRDRVAGVDHRMPGLGQNGGGGSDRGGVAAQPRRDAGRHHQVEVALLLEDVAGQRQEDRPGRRRERGLDGAMHQARQVGHAMDLGGPFDEGPRQRGQVGGKNRLGDDVILILLAGGEQNGRARLLGVVEHAHGVAEPRRHVEIQDREPAGRPRRHPSAAARWCRDCRIPSRRPPASGARGRHAFRT